MGWSAVLEWLGTTRERMEAQRRSRLRWLQGSLFLLFISMVGFALLQLRMAWMTAQWLDWAGVWSGVFFAGLCAFFPLIRMESRAIQLREENALALREVAVAGDDERAPIAKEQPERLPDVERALSFEQVSRVKPVPGYMARNGLAIGGLWLTFSSLAVGRSFASPNHDLSNGFGFLYLFLFSFACIFVFAGLKGRKTISITADAQSFTWRWSRRRVTVEWSDVRAFCRIARPEPRAGSRGTVYYLLATEQVVLLWQRPMREGAKGYGEAERLASLAATYVGVPLRDLTREATRQAEIAGRGGFGTKEERAHLPPRPAGWKRRTLYPFFAALLIEVLLAATCVGALLAQPRSYARCLAQAQARPPLFSDTLTRDDGRWPVRTASAADGGTLTYTYIHNSYTLADEQGYQQVSAWTSPTFTDATVEVTVRQVSDFDLSGAGLILRANDRTHTLLILTVNSDGSWSLYTLPSDDLSGDKQQIHEINESAAIVRDDFAPNRLAVIMRVNEYTIFINGQLAGSYYADGPTSGHAGITVDALAAVGAFNDFAVYPAPPPSCLLPW